MSTYSSFSYTYFRWFSTTCIFRVDYYTKPSKQKKTKITRGRLGQKHRISQPVGTGAKSEKRPLAKQITAPKIFIRENVIKCDSFGFIEQ